MNVCFCCVRFCFLSSSQEIGCEECAQTDLFCVEWDTRTLTESRSQSCVTKSCDKITGVVLVSDEKWKQAR